MLERVLRLLVCPLCGGSLDRDFPTGKLGGRVRMAELSCRGCHTPFAVREGVGLLAGPAEEGAEWRADPGLLHNEPDEGRWAAYLASLPPQVPPAFDRAVRGIIEAVRDVSGLLMDLATCRGHVLRPLAGETGAHQLLLGSDLEVARLYGAQAGLKHDRHYTGVSLIEMDATRWPLRPGAASAVISFYGPSILPRGRKVVREAARVLREDGPFVFSTLLTGERTLTLRQAKPLQLDELLTEKRLRSALERSGFVVDAWEVLAGGDAWPVSRYDPIPVRGDPWQHVLVRARRHGRPAGRPSL